MADVVTGKATVGIMAAPGSNNPQSSVPGAVQTQNATTLAQTRSQAPFPVSVPGYLAGFEFLQASVMTQPRKAVVMTFAGENKRAGFQLFQAPASQYESSKPGQATYFVVADNVSETAVGQAKGARSALPANRGGIANTSLVWEKGDLLFHVLAHGLSDQEINRIALSV